MVRNRAALVAMLALWGACAKPPPAAALDLGSALRQVAEQNPSLAARRAMVEAARRRIAPAGAWSPPMLELGALNVPTSGRFDMDPMTMKMVGLSQRVPVFGANRLSRRAADAGLIAEGAATEMATNELYGMTWEAYADAFYASELARDAEGHRDVMDRLVRSARARYGSGNGRLEDVLRAEAERARELVDVAAYRSEERAALARLDALCGVVPGSSPDTLVPPPAPAVPPDPGSWIAAVTASHPRLREMSARVERYRLAARAARRSAWPEIELKGSYGVRAPLAGTQQDNMFSGTVGLELPLFAGQRELSEAAEMEAMARASESERRAAELELMEQVAAAHAAASAGQRTVRLLADTVVTTQRGALDASWVAYSTGATDLWRVFESDHALYDEEIALTRARQDLARAAARMLALTGRGDLVGIALPETKGSEP